jgi:hypothetical protein
MSRWVLLVDGDVGRAIELTHDGATAIALPAGCAWSCVAGPVSLDARGRESVLLVVAHRSDGLFARMLADDISADPVLVQLGERGEVVATITVGRVADDEQEPPRSPLN